MKLPESKLKRIGGKLNLTYADGKEAQLEREELCADFLTCLLQQEEKMDQNGGLSPLV